MLSLFSLGNSEKAASVLEKAAAALLYAASSVGIMMLNKMLLTSFAFPSSNFIAVTQYATSLLVLLVQRHMGLIDFPPLTWEAVRHVSPLPLFFLVNTLSGLGATKRLTMPMFVLLRRFSIVMTLVLEMYLLRKTFRSKVHVAIAVMILGALIAAAGDLRVDVVGYTLIFLNDLFTALQGVILRKKMDEKGKMSSEGLMFYNNLFALPIALGIMLATPGEFNQALAFEGWKSVLFPSLMVMAAIMGFVINFAYYLCTKVNSPLTTTVIGCLKNVFTSYAGMIFVDFHYTHLGLIGVNVSVFGSLIYQHAEWQKIKELELQRQKEVRSERRDETV